MYYYYIIKNWFLSIYYKINKPDEKPLLKLINNSKPENNNLEEPLIKEPLIKEPLIKEQK